VCNPDTFIKTYLQYTDLLEKVGFRRVNYDPTATTTTTKPVTTTKSINTTKPVTKVTNRVVRTGIVVDKDVNIVVIQSQKVVNT